MTAGGDVAILLLAAGSSSRMQGGDKLLERIDGEPLLRRQARAALATGARVLVALPPGAAARTAALEGLAVERVTVSDAALGMGHSLAAGARAASGASGLMVVPADMALIDSRAMTALRDAFQAGPDRIWRGATPEGEAGHPVVFPARLFGALARLTGDRGARAVLDAEAALTVPLAGDTAVLDLDTPEAWAAFRARRQ
jgi:molybdenum cofactor cytidylyltransferase